MSNEKGGSADRKQALLMNGKLFQLPQSVGGKPYLIGSRCTACRYTSFPAKTVCPVCLEPNTMKELPLGRVGKIDTFAISRIGTVQHKAPYIQAFVDLPEGPRVFASIINCAPTEEAVRIGMEVELVIDEVGTDEDGKGIIGYQFQPVTAGQRGDL